MALKLDRKQPFGQIFGDDQGRVYSQGEHHFKGDGTLWRDPKKKETDAERKEREAEEAAAAEAAAAEAKAAEGAGSTDDQLSKQLSTGSTGGAA